MTTIKVNTKSNYNNCNDKPLEVVSFCGTIIEAKVPQYGYDENGTPQGNMITASFSIKEIVAINN